MKKFLATILALVMVLSLVACGGDNGGTSENKEAAENTPVATKGVEALTFDGDKNGLNTDIKIGIVLVGDETEGYTAAHMNGLKEAMTTLGIDPAGPNVMWAYMIPEQEVCYDKCKEFANAGCSIIFTNSYGHQSYAQQAASEFPNVQFVSMTGDTAKTAGLDNFANAFTDIYQARYVSGVVAGMKIAELDKEGKIEAKNKTEDGKVKIGYVGAFPYAEVVSGYTAFYLGIKSVYENAWMEVQYTGSWFDLSKENEAAKQLISDGCIIIGQHADSTGAPQACQDALKSGTTVYSIGYNIDMLATAPDAALTSATNNWGVYYTYAIAQAMRGQKVATNWVGGFDIDAVAVTQLGSACAAGTAEKVAEVEKAIHDGTLQVFDTSKFTISTKCTDGSYRTDDNGKVLVACATDTDSNFANDTDNAIIDGAYQESYTQSAPSFVLRIDGIKELNANS